MCGFSQLSSGTLRKSPEVTGNFGRFPPEVSGSLRNFFATLPGKVNKSKMRPTPKKPFPPEVSGSLRKSPEVSGTIFQKKNKKKTKKTILFEKNFSSQENQFFFKTQTQNTKQTRVARKSRFLRKSPEVSGSLRKSPKKISFFQNTNTKHKTNTFCLFPPKPSGTIRNPSENSRNTPGITEVMVPDTF